MKKKEHLPLFGVGPYYVSIIIGLTLLAFLLRNSTYVIGGRIKKFQVVFTIFGILLILISVLIWFQAVFVAKLDTKIKKNRLVTNGIFAWVRNPIYSAFLILCTGFICLIGNWYFYFLPIIYWIFLTVLMINTEEKWLKKQFGQEYEEYCRNVNRCIPRKPRSSWNKSGK